MWSRIYSSHVRYVGVIQFMFVVFHLRNITQLMSCVQMPSLQLQHTSSTGSHMAHTWLIYATSLYLLLRDFGRFQNKCKWFNLDQFAYCVDMYLC